MGVVRFRRSLQRRLYNGGGATAASVAAALPCVGTLTERRARIYFRYCIEQDEPRQCATPAQAQ
jgi:hypothetical protein